MELDVTPPPNQLASADLHGNLEGFFLGVEGKYLRYVYTEVGYVSWVGGLGCITSNKAEESMYLV